MWVFSKKDESKYKARLVVKGFKLKEIIKNIYFPVAKMQTLELLLSYFCQEGLKIYPMDVETAFLNSIIKSEINMKQPQGFEIDSEKVCKLQKALYSLREIPRAWYECFDSFMKSLKLKNSDIDNFLYSLNNGRDKVYIVLFVDDLLICCKSQNTIDNNKRNSSKKF